MTFDKAQLRGCRRRWVMVSAMTAVLATSAGLRVAVQAVDGELDATFGIGGRVVTDGATLVQETPVSVALQADGKIVVAGTGFGVTARGFALARYNVDGSLDPSFAGGGTTVVEFATPIARADAFAFAVAIQADGKIVAAGGVVGPFPSEFSAFAAARLLPDGTLDPSFGVEGRVTTVVGGGGAVVSAARAIAIQPDGRILVAGTTQDNTARFAVLRYNTNGSLDASFDGDGKQTTALGAFGFAFAVGLQSDGKIVVGGAADVDGSGVPAFALVRYHTDGSLDASFGTDGRVITPAGSIASATALTIQPDDKIILAGTVLVDTESAFGLARYDADGTFDPTFNGGAIVTTNFGQFPSALTAVALQVDGKIVAAGLSVTATGLDFTVARFQAGGILDPEFAVGGVAHVDYDNGDEFMGGVAIQGDGKIVVAGLTQPPSSTTSKFALARFDGPPPHELTFFLHGHDAPGTAGGLTMNAVPAPRLQLLIGTRTWFSDPALVGTFLQGATFQVTMPCAFGISVSRTVRLATTNPTGGEEQILGEATRGLTLCHEQTIGIPVKTPLALANRRLKLRISSGTLLPAVLLLGERTFLRASAFVGTP